MSVLHYLSRRDNEWRKMARKFAGAEYEDVLHDAYLKLCQRFNSADELKSYHPNQVAMYVYLTIRSVFLKAKDHLSLDSDIPEVEVEDYNYDQDARDEKKIAPLLEEIETWYWFDREIFKLYYFKGYKQRQIARETNISVSTIHTTIKTCEEKLCTKASQIATTKH